MTAHSECWTNYSSPLIKADFEGVRPSSAWETDLKQVPLPGSLRLLMAASEHQ